MPLSSNVAIINITLLLPILIILVRPITLFLSLALQPHDLLDPPYQAVPLIVAHPHLAKPVLVDDCRIVIRLVCYGSWIVLWALHANQMEVIVL